MKLYHDYTNDDVLICELSMSDVVEAEKEFSLYMQKDGETYKKDTNKEPCVRNFFKLYFGEEEYDIYCGECYYTPGKYICSDENTANRFVKLAKCLAYHDRYNQTYCDVEQNGKIVEVFNGDY